MKTFGTLYKSLWTSLIVIVLVISIAIPHQSITAQGTAITNDEFTGTTLNSNTWTLTHSEGGASISVAGGELRINVPADSTSYTFSNTNKRAPRILQEIEDVDFAVEVKFTSAMSVYQDDKIQGILVYDQAGTKWLRFDFNTDGDSLNTYMGYIDPGGVLRTIEIVSAISNSHSAGPLYMRVQYTRSTNQWMMSYRIGDTGSFIVKKTFTESNALGTSGITFAPTHIGLFAGSTGNVNPGHLMTADYIRNVVPDVPVDYDEFVYLPFIRR